MRFPLRAACAEDAPAIAALFAASRAAAMPWLPVLHTPAEDLAYLQGVVADQRVWVAEVEGRIAGFMALGAGFLHHLYVDPRFQGQGLGDGMFLHARRSLPLGFRFWVFQQNTRARAFYEHRGARLIRLGDGSGNEERTPDALYEWIPSA
jgi:GNAT superfamily N-acetyltransferase